MIVRSWRMRESNDITTEYSKVNYCSHFRGGCHLSVRSTPYLSFFFLFPWMVAVLDPWRRECPWLRFHVNAQNKIRKLKRTKRKKGKKGKKGNKKPKNFSYQENHGWLVFIHSFIHSWINTYLSGRSCRCCGVAGWSVVSDTSLRSDDQRHPNGGYFCQVIRMMEVQSTEYLIHWGGRKPDESSKIDLLLSPLFFLWQSHRSF